MRHFHLFTVAHKGHAANKKETLQIKKKRCKQKRNAANKKETLQTKEKRCKQKRDAANKKEALQTKKGTPANIKKGTLQIKKRNAAGSLADLDTITADVLHSKRQIFFQKNSFQTVFILIFYDLLRTQKSFWVL